MARGQQTRGRDPIEDLYTKIDLLERQVESLSGNKLGTVDRGDTTVVPAPVEGQQMVHAPDESLQYYSNGEWRRSGGGANSNAVYAIKLSGDDRSVHAPAFVDAYFQVGIPTELTNWYVVKFWAYTTDFDGGSTDTELSLGRFDIPNAGGLTAAAITTTSVAIAPDKFWPTTYAVIDQTENQVTGDSTLLLISVDAVELNAIWGLSCEITLSPSNVLL